jgi:DNA-binding response OmpR family regulator
MPKALVVDDEANIRELVSVYLGAAGFDVEQASHGAEALAQASATEFDVIILDIMLPGTDGVAVCRTIRERSQVPIIMLTARDNELDKVALLESGADDYVTKPFSPPELVARVRAVLRRTQQPEVESRLTVGNLSICAETREVLVAGEPVDLTTKEFDLLHAMMRSPGVVFSRDQLLEAAWGFAEYVDPRGVDVHIRHLREKLGDDAASPRFIDTVRGVGYRVRKAGSA